MSNAAFVLEAGAAGQRVDTSLSAQNLRGQKAVRDYMEGLRQIGISLQQSVRGEPSRAPVIPGQPQTLKVHMLSEVEAFNAIRSSAQGFIDLGNYVRIINRLGRSAEDRDNRVAVNLMPIALRNVYERRNLDKEKSNGAFVRVSQAEYCFMRAYLATHNNEIPYPDWSWPASALVDVSAKMSGLPGAEFYLLRSNAAKANEACAAELRGLSDLRDSKAAADGAVSQFDIKKQGQQKKENKADVGIAPADAKGNEPKNVARDSVSSRSGVLQRQITQSEDKLFEFFKELVVDVNPQLFEELCKPINVVAKLKNEEVSALVSLSKDVARLIEIAVSSNESPNVRTVSQIMLPELVVDANGVGKVLRSNISISELVSGSLIKESLPELVSLFYGLRTAMVAAHEALNVVREQAPAVEMEKKSLETQIDRLLPLSQAGINKVLNMMTRSSDPAMQSLVADLLTAKISQRGSIGGAIAQTTLLASPDNIELLAWAVNALINGPEEAAEKINASIQGTALKAVGDFASSISNLISKFDYLGIGEKVDREIAECLELTNGSYGRLAGLLLSLHVLSKNPKVCRVLKNSLQRLDDVPEIASRLASQNDMSMHSRESASFVEKIRAEACRAFSVVLDDYIGHNELKAEMLKRFQENILLLEHPEVWAGKNTNEVLINGFIIHGKPGVGKTFLIKCLCNTLGLPIITISREEMSSAFKQAKQSSEDLRAVQSYRAEQRMEAQFSEFMSKKIASAYENMRKNKTPASVLLMDEIEGEMLERSLIVGAPEQLALTNAMLRVMEKEKSKHPKIIFVSATNHLEFVDLAARRQGRFGIGIEVGSVTFEDAKEFIRKTLASLEIELDTCDENPQFLNLARKLEGMNPGPITNALTNHCCIKKAEALRSGNSALVITYPELEAAVDRMKDYTRVSHGEAKKSAAEEIKNLTEEVRGLKAALLSLVGKEGASVDCAAQG